MPNDQFLAEIQAYDPSTRAVTTLRYATGLGLTTTPSDTPANTFYDGRIRQPSTVSRSLFSEGRTVGRSKVGFGDLVLLNGDGSLDGLIDYGFDGQTITIKRGTEGAAYSSFVTYLVATMDQVEVSGETMVVKIRDKQRDLTQPLQPKKYAGNNVLPAGLEGVEGDLKGKPKPLCFGKVMNVPAVCVNSSKLIYQVHDGALASVEAVYDSGINLGQNLEGWSGNATAVFGSNVVRAVAVGYKADQSQIAVAVADGGIVGYTLDGSATWLADASPGFGSGNLYAVAFGPVGGATTAGYIIAGAAGALSTFTAPSQTTSRTSQFGASTIRGLCYSPWLNLWVAVGDGGKISTSADYGATWTARTSGVATALNGVTAGPRVLVAVGASGVILTSSDGTTWTSQTSPFGATAVNAIAYGDGEFMAVGSSDKVARCVSSLGIGWTLTTGVFGGSLNHYGVTFSAGRFLSVGEDVSVASTTGEGIWALHTQTTGTAIDYYAAARIPDGCWLAAGADTTVGTVGTVYSTSGATNYASLTALQSDSSPPTAGCYKTYLAGGFIRLGSPPLGPITVDATEGTSAGQRTAGQLFARVLQRAGKATGDWSAADVTAMDTANDSVLGLWTNDETTFADVIDQIANSVGAWWGPDLNGVYRLKQLVAPSGTAVVSFTANDLKRPPARVVASDDAKGLPSWKTILRYGRNYQVQTAGVAGGVSSDRRAYLATEYREATAQDTAVLNGHLLAPQDSRDTLFQVAADALEEATRQQVMRGIQRHQFELVVALNDDTDGLDLGDVISLTHSRYGLSGGKLFRVIGLEPNARDRELTIRAWGPSDPISLTRLPALALAGTGTVS